MPDLEIEYESVSYEIEISEATHIETEITESTYEIELDNQKNYEIDLTDRQPLELELSKTGPRGPAGDETYVYYQDNPETIWEINHDRGGYPSVTVVDSSGKTVFGGPPVYEDENNIKIEFDAAFSGKAYLN